MKKTLTFCSVLLCQLGFGQSSVTIFPDKVVVKDGSVSADVRTSTFMGGKLDLDGTFITSTVYSSALTNQVFDNLDVGRNVRVSLTGTGNTLRSINGAEGQHIFLYTTNPLTVKHLYSAGGISKIATPNGADYVLSPNGEDQETHLVKLSQAWIIVK
jgi:hypothetical protein